MHGLHRTPLLRPCCHRVLLLLPRPSVILLLLLLQRRWQQLCWLHLCSGLRLLLQMWLKLLTRILLLAFAW